MRTVEVECVLYVYLVNDAGYSNEVHRKSRVAVSSDAPTNQLRPNPKPTRDLHPRLNRRHRPKIPIASFPRLSTTSCPRQPPTMASIMRPTLLRSAIPKPATIQRSSLSTLAARSVNRPLAQHLRPAALQRAAFHASQRNQILPPLPQKIIGTANEPVPVPDPDYAHGSYHWSFERIVSAGLIPLTLAPFAAGSLNPVTDSILCALLVVHSHIGFEYV